MTVAVSTATDWDRKAAHTLTSAKPSAAPERVMIDVEAGRGCQAEEDSSDAKPQYPPRWQYFRSLGWLRPALTLLLLYCLSLGAIWALYKRLPDLQALEALSRKQHGGGSGSSLAGVGGEVVALRLALPKSFDELRAVRHTIELYRTHYGGELLALLVAAYLFLQAFMIPGCVCINILAGSMYPFSAAFAFVGVVSTLGASLNYWLVRGLLRDVVANLLPSRVAAFSTEVSRHRAHLFNYMLFLRATPILPGWFISLASPIVGVPFATFVLATALGHQPMNVITVQAGKALAEIHSMRDLYSPRNVGFMLLVGVVALIPVGLKWRQQHRQAGASSNSGSSGVAKMVAVLRGGGDTVQQKPE